MDVKAIIEQIKVHPLHETWKLGIINKDAKDDFWEKFVGSEFSKKLRIAKKDTTYEKRLNELNSNYLKIKDKIRYKYSVDLDDLLRYMKEAEELSVSNYDPLALLDRIGYKGNSIEYRDVDYARIQKGADSTYAAVFFLKSFKPQNKNSVNQKVLRKMIENLSKFFDENFLNKSLKMKKLKENASNSENFTKIEIISLLKDILDEYEGVDNPSKAFSHLKSLSRHYRSFRKNDIEGLWIKSNDPYTTWTINENGTFYFIHRVEEFPATKKYRVDKFKAIVERFEGKFYLKVIAAENLLKLIQGCNPNDSLDANLSIKVKYDNKKEIEIREFKEGETNNTLLKELCNNKLTKLVDEEKDKRINKLVGLLCSGEYEDISPIKISFSNTLVAITRDKLYIGSYSLKKESPGQYKFLYCINKSSKIYKKYFKFADFDQFVGVIVCKEKNESKEEVYLGNANLESYLKIVEGEIRDDDNEIHVLNDSIFVDRMNKLAEIEEEDYMLLPDFLQFSRKENKIELNDSDRDILHLIKYSEH